MNHAVVAMLEKYDRRSLDEYLNAMREILQEIALCGLWRGKFFERAVFYGGTALRVLYGLDRFSEDMDFSLIIPDKQFDFSPYCDFMEDELTAWGFAPQVTVKEKTADSAINSAFLKVNTKELLLTIAAGEEITGSVHADQALKIKIEVDTDPPPLFRDEAHFLLQPIPFSVRVYDQPSLFAGKMHALLCRNWGKRVKGRDWYDFVWYVGRGIPLDLAHLEARMRQSGHLSSADDFDEAILRKLLNDRISGLDINMAKSDVERFLVNPSAIMVWSREFFQAVALKVIINKSTTL